MRKVASTSKSGLSRLTSERLLLELGFTSAKRGRGIELGIGVTLLRIVVRKQERILYY